MDLMKNAPDTGSVANSVPPVKRERANEPAHKPLGNWQIPILYRDDRNIVEEVDPQATGRQGDAELRKIDR